MKFRKNQRQGRFQRRSTDDRKDRFKRRENTADGKKSKVDLSQIKCYKCQKMGHFANECGRLVMTKGRAKH